MRRLIVAITFIFNTSCSDAADTQSATGPDVDCSFEYGIESLCTYKLGAHAVQVTLVTRKLADTEVALTQAHVVVNGKQRTLSISPDVTMTAGDVGIVSFADIDFDNIPDIAISTSFGLANQYFDYWRYDPKLRTYNSIGNYPKLSGNRAKKVLTANVKLNVAAYETQTYSWEKGKLVRRK